jgi:O-antigen ligase
VLAVRDPDALTLFHYTAFLYVILYVSRFIEFLPAFLRPILLFSVILLGGALISGRILAFLETTAGKLMLGFMIWLSITSIFSSWPRQSINTTLEMYKVMMSMMIVIAFTSSAKAALGMLVSAGLGLGLAAVYPFISGGAMGNRLVVETMEGGSMADPNYFGLFLVCGIPLLALATFRLQKILKVIPLVLLPLALFSLVRTGSRSGMVALVLMLFFVFLQLPGKQKVKMLFLAGGALGIVLAFAPSTVLLRFTSMVSSDVGRAQTEEELAELSRAGGSGEERIHLMKQALILTMRNPLFGVGAKMFATAEQDLAMNVQGMTRGSRHVSHNAYFQASAETGIPGFLLLLGIVFVTFRNVGSIRKWCQRNYHPLGRDLWVAALAMQATLVALFAEMFFLSTLFSGFIWILIAVAVGFVEGARHELTRPQSPAGGGQQAPPANMLEGPSVILAKDLARVGNVPVQSPGKQFIRSRQDGRVAGDRPVPGEGWSR